MTIDVHGLDACTHCGFCLQSCPTFLVTGDEADGPRGRIELMRELAGGRLSGSDAALRYHLDRCLGCRACETVCPPGVAYGVALEHVREAMADASVPISVRMVNYVMADRRVQNVAFAGARAVRPLARRFAGPSRVGFALGMLAATAPRHRDAPHPDRTAATPPTRTAALFTGCIMTGLFAHVHDATARVLARHGFALLPVEGQRCCGALHAHTGQRGDAVTLARDNVAAFAALPGDTVIVANSAGCGAMLKEYARLLDGDPLAEAALAISARVRDISEILVEAGPQAGGPLPLRVVYDPPCHLQHAQRIADPPLRMLRAIDGLELVVHREADLCCGSAGSYSLAEPAMSRTVLERKIHALLEAEPDVIATGNPGCIMQIGAGLRAAGYDTPVVHPIELLDRAYAVNGDLAERETTS